MNLCECVNCISQSRGPRTIMWLASWSFILRSPQSIFRSSILPHNPLSLCLCLSSNSSHIQNPPNLISCKYYPKFSFKFSTQNKRARQKSQMSSIRLESCVCSTRVCVCECQGIPPPSMIGWFGIAIGSPVNWLFMFKHFSFYQFHTGFVRGSQTQTNIQT